MAVAEGVVTLLGNSKVQDGGICYSTIEIGGQLLSNMQCSNKLDNFLQRSLDQSGNTKLFYEEKDIVGIQLPDGKMYVQKWYYENIVVLTIIVCLAVITIILIPLLFVTFKKYNHNKKCTKLAEELLKQGAIQL